MTREEYAKRKERAEHETFVIAKTEDGYRIHSPNAPGNVYRVWTDDGALACSCPDFEVHSKDPEWKCKHVFAVEARFPATATPTQEKDDYEREERAAIREESRPITETPAGRPPQSPASEMCIKRSVSPDGRIDSMSVEFSCPIEATHIQEIKSKAMKTLGLQNEILSEFLERNGGARGSSDRFYRRDRTEDSDRDALPAQILGIGAMDTRWGRRLFLRVQVNGDTLRYFGNQKKLADAIEAAGFPDAAEHVSEGVRLNLPCRVTTKPSDDGRYVNIDQVFPAGMAKSSRWRDRR